MEKGRKALFSLVFAGMIFISGCADLPFFSGLIGGTDVKQYEHDIIVIKDVKVTPSPNLRPGQYANLHVYVKNVLRVGNEPKEASVMLYDTCSIFDIINSGSICPSASGGGSGMINSGTTCELEMYPQSEQEIIWRLRAKNIPVEQKCSVGIQVVYDHETSTISSVEFASQEEIEKIVQQGKGKTTVGRMTVGEGPVKLYIKVPGQPLLVSKGENREVGVMQFWVENKGSGIVENNEVKNYVIENLALTGTHKIFFKESPDKKITKNRIDAKLDGLSRKIIGKKTPIYTWLIIPSDNLLADKIFTTMQLKGSVEYTYKFTKNIQMTVTPIL